VFGALGVASTQAAPAEGRFEFVTHALGPVRVVKAADGHIYAGVNHRLQVYAAAGRQQPRLVHEAPSLDQKVTDIAIDGNRLYVAADSGGLVIYDRSDPAQPKRLGHLKGLSPLSLAASGPVLFAACGTAGIKVLDVSDPRAPRVIATLNESIDYRRLHYRAPHLFAADSGLQFLVYDATVPDALKRLGSLTTAKPVQQIEVSGNVAYLAAGLAGLRIVDVADPQHPVEIGHSLQHDGEDAVGVALSGPFALVADRTYDVGRDYFRGRLRMVDVSDPRRPVQLDSVYGNLVGVAAEAGKAYAGVFDPNVVSQIDVVDVASKRIRRLASAFVPMPGHPDMRVQGNDVLLPDVSLARLNLDRPDRPHIRWTREVADPIQRRDEYGGSELLLADGMAFVFASSDTIRLVDVSDLDRPRLKAAIPLRGPAVAATQGVLYAKPFSSQHDVILYDIRHPDLPVPIGTIADSESVGDGFIAGRYLYLFPAFWSTKKMLRVYDIAEPAAPVLLAVRPWFQMQAWQAVGDRLYVVKAHHFKTDALLTYSLGNPPELERIGQWRQPTSSTQSLRVCGTTAFLGNSTVGGPLLAVDVSDPAAPFETARYSVPGFAPYTAVCTDNNSVVVDIGDGVHVLRYVPPGG
jgi:hypothetical protein